MRLVVRFWLEVGLRVCVSCMWMSAFVLSMPFCAVQHAWMRVIDAQQIYSYIYHLCARWKRTTVRIMKMFVAPLNREISFVVVVPRPVSVKCLLRIYCGVAFAYYQIVRPQWWLCGDECRESRELCELTKHVRRGAMDGLWCRRMLVFYLKLTYACRSTLPFARNDKRWPRDYCHSPNPDFTATLSCGSYRNRTYGRLDPKSYNRI